MAAGICPRPPWVPIFIGKAGELSFLLSSRKARQSLSGTQMGRCELGPGYVRLRDHSGMTLLGCFRTQSDRVRGEVWSLS